MTNKAFVYELRGYEILNQEEVGARGLMEKGYLVRTLISPNQYKELVRAESPVELGSKFAEYLDSDKDHYRSFLDDVIFKMDGDLEATMRSTHRKPDFHLVTHRYANRPLGEGEMDDFLDSYSMRMNELTAPRTN